MHKLIALVFTCCCVSLYGQHSFFYPSADCSNGQITHCYTGEERRFILLQTYDSILSLTANGTNCNYTITPTKTGNIVLKAIAIAGRDTLTFSDTLLAITKPKIELRLKSTRNQLLDFGIFDKNTGKEYTDKVFANCFFEVEVYDKKNKAISSSTERGWLYNAGRVQKGCTVLIRAFPLDKRTGRTFDPLEIKYVIP